MYTVLVVDDEKYIADNIASLLKKHLPSYKINAAYIPKTALKIAATDPVDILVTDIEMPGMSGFLLSDQITRMHPRCRTVILTAYNKSEYMLQAFRHDVVDYVLKLEDEDTLITAVSKAAKGVESYRRNMQELPAGVQTAKQLGGENASHEYDALLAKIFLFINQNYETDISLVRIAEHVNFNSSYLSRLFKKVYGQTLSEYIWDFKISKAKEMLRESQMKIKEISDRLGFESNAYFTRFFKRMTGITPKEYRTQNRYSGL